MNVELTLDVDGIESLIDLVDEQIDGAVNNLAYYAREVRKGNPSTHDYHVALEQVRSYSSHYDHWMAVRARLTSDKVQSTKNEEKSTLPRGTVTPCDSDGVPYFKTDKGVWRTDHDTLFRVNGVPWTKNDSQLAEREGWLISESYKYGLEVERDDEMGEFFSDRDAWNHVVHHACDGDHPTHTKALYITAHSRLRYTFGTAPGDS